MRILVISQYFWPEPFRVNDLVEELKKRGHEVTILTGVPNYPDGEVFPHYRDDPEYFLSYHGAKVVRVPMLSRGRRAIRLMLNYASFALSASVIGAWKLRKQKFDAIFVFEPSPITVGIPAAVIRRIKKVPVAFWVLDLWPETLSAVGVVRAQWALDLVGRLVRWIYRRCDLILVQSRSFADQVVRYAPRERICYFPSWSESVFDLDDVEPAPEVSQATDQFNIVFTGNIGDAQDFPTVLDAAEMLAGHGVRWLIVGDGRMADWVRTEVKRRGLASSVILPGRFPLERMSSFFKHADALLVSLKDDPIFAMTIPGKVQSYLATGRPIVGMLNGEGARIIEESGAGLTCKAGDSVALSDAVLQMAKMSKDERSQMGLNGPRIIETYFDRRKLMDRLERLLSGMEYSSPPCSRCDQVQ